LLTVGDHPHIPDKTMYNLKGLCSGQFGLVLGESVKPLENRLGILLSEQFLDKFLCPIVSGNIQYDREYRLTWFSLPNLLGRNGERREQLYQYLDKDFSHSDSGSDLGIDVEAI
jgi:hypothetical protein